MLVSFCCHCWEGRSMSNCFDLCSRYFANITVRDEHFKTKRHKKRYAAFDFVCFLTPFVLNPILHSPHVYIWRLIRFIEILFEFWGYSCFYLWALDSRKHKVKGYVNYERLLFYFLLSSTSIKSCFRIALSLSWSGNTSTRAWVIFA